MIEDRADADLRIRVRGVRVPLRRARLQRGRRPALPGLRLGARPAAVLDGLPTRSPAARRQGQVRRIAPRRARIRPSGAPGVRSREAGAGGTAVSLPAEERREALVDLYKEVQACTRCPLHETRTKA